MSETKAYLTFDALDHVLEQLGVTLDAAECHGILCGLLCASEDVDGLSFAVNVIEGRLDPENTLPPALVAKPETPLPEGAKPLLALYELTLSQLNDPEYGFQVLLPDAEQPIAVRAAALARWCEGLLYGLSLGGIKKEAKLSGNIAEILRDLGDIARLASNVEEGGEEDEEDYTEIEEYVRMAILLLHKELEPWRSSKPTTHALH